MYLSTVNYLLFFASILFSANLYAKDNMVIIPAGTFVMGSNRIDMEGLGKRYGSSTTWYQNEHPERVVYLDQFTIDRYEVTNQSYREYVRANAGSVTRFWVENGYALSVNPKLAGLMNRAQLLEALQAGNITLSTKQQDDVNYLRSALVKYWQELDVVPVMFVSWHEANAYCHWIGKKLPTEAQWEKAARGEQGNEFPWGSEWHEDLSNTANEKWPYLAAPVGSYATDRSVYGVHDLAGNVQEWVDDWYQAYPGATDTDPDYGHVHKVIRGASYLGTGHYALAHFQRGAFRWHARADNQKAGLGFRCAK